MGEVLEKAGILLFISVLSYGLKRAGLFHAADYKPFSRLVMNVTLPCAAITAFSQGFRQDGVFFWATCFGLAGNILMAFLGWCISRKKNKTDKGFWILTASGYNVGAFTMPFVQGFLSPVSMVAACMFDIGNAILCTGGTYAFLNIVVLGDVKEKGRLKAFVRTFFFLCFCGYIFSFASFGFSPYRNSISSFAYGAENWRCKRMYGHVCRGAYV